MRIWRVEDLDGVGPYQRADRLMPPWASPRHPSVMEDPGVPRLEERWPYFNDRIIRFGFPSLQAMRNWFWGYLGKLHKAGYRLVEYEVPDADAVVGVSQVVYDRTRAALVAVHPINYTGGETLARPRYSVKAERAAEDQREFYSFLTSLF